MSNKVKIQCGGFYLGDGLTMDGNTLKSSGGEQVQSDWNQNNSAAADYIKNRPFYEESTEIIPETTFQFVQHSGIMMSTLPESFDLVEGQKYTISWDGTDYVCACILLDGVSLTLGNLGLLGVGTDTGEPFIFTYQEVWVAMSNDSATEHTIGINRIDKLVQIDAKYVPYDSAPYKAPIIISKKIENMSDSEKEQINNAFKSGSLILYAYDPDKIGLCGVITYFYFDKSSSILKYTYFSENYINYYDSSVNPPIVHSVELSYDSMQTMGEYAAKDILQKNPLKYFLLNSSTANSAKKFRITVDDSGNISATEVTA